MRLSQLKWYLRAVANAILDHKMHCTGMTDEQAMDLLVRQAYQSEGEAVGKVIRAKQSSCQLSTYFVGRMAFYTLRQKVQRKMGERFDLGRYHEAALTTARCRSSTSPSWCRSGWSGRAESVSDTAALMRAWRWRTIGARATRRSVHDRPACSLSLPRPAASRSAAVGSRAVLPQLAARRPVRPDATGRASSSSSTAG
ncbi:MAG: DUF885 family protein [Gemmataceae bacterium]